MNTSQLKNILSYPNMKENNKKYLNHYICLIVKRQTNIIPLDTYREKHHIIPKCIGGTNRKENLIFLTPEEHYVAHLLLVKIFPSNAKLLFAVKMMTVNNPHGQRNNKMYGWVKKKISVEMSKIMKEYRKEHPLNGKNNPMYGKKGNLNPQFGSKRTKEQCENISKSLLGNKHPMFGKFGKDNPRFGQKHSKETILKMKKPKTEEQKQKLRVPKTEEHKLNISKTTSDGRRKGKNSYSYGMKWINNGKINKKVTKEKLKTWLDMGWVRGFNRH